MVFVTVTDAGLDGILESSADNDVRTLSFAVRVWPVNDPPDPEADQYQAAQSELLTVPTGLGVLANDRNVDPGDRLTVQAGTIRSEGGGTVIFDPSGSFLYEPADSEREINLGIGEPADESTPARAITPEIGHGRHGWEIRTDCTD